MPRRAAATGAPVKRDSVVECSSPLELWPKSNLANERVNELFPDAAMGERLTAHAKTQRVRTNHGRSAWPAGTCSKAVEGHRTRGRTESACGGGKVGELVGGRGHTGRAMLGAPDRWRVRPAPRHREGPWSAPPFPPCRRALPGQNTPPTVAENQPIDKRRMHNELASLASLCVISGREMRG